MSTTYYEQLNCAPGAIDLDFWRAPQGVAVPDDELDFLLVPDAVEAQAVAALAADIHDWQDSAGAERITALLMAAMGGLLPGILLHDHLMHGGRGDACIRKSGSVGISLYKGPDERHSGPVANAPCTIPLAGERVLVIDDLGDRGDTLKFLGEYLRMEGASSVLTAVLYMKPRALASCPVDFHFGEVAQSTWIITPRERVETMAMRIPVWRERGADSPECRRRLVELIGFPPDLVDHYLPRL